MYQNDWFRTPPTSLHYSRVMLSMGPTLSRRHFVAGAASVGLSAAAGAASYFAASAGRAAAAQARMREQVSILDYWSPGDRGAGLPHAFSTAFRAARTVEVPAGVELGGISGTIVIPEGRDLALYGRMVGASGSAAAIRMEGTGTVFNSGGLFDDISLQLRGGSPRIIGYRGRGRSHTAMILIQGEGTYENLRIEDWEVWDCNYGILRQGRGSSLRGASILNGRARNLVGDAVQWNVCVNDRNVQVVGLEIDRIDSGPGRQRPNWGIGVGFAGNGYDSGWGDDRTVKDFVIARISGRSLRQLVHVESGHRFEISEISGQDISEVYSQGAGIECATVICYGCKDFSISGVRNSLGSPRSGIFARFGVSGGRYAAPCRDFTISGINLEVGDVLIEPGMDDGAFTVSDANLLNGSLIVIGSTGSMRFERVRARRGRGSRPAIDINMLPVGDGRDRFRAASVRLSMIDCQGVNSDGSPSAAVRLAPGTAIETQATNFNLPRR